MGQKNPNLGTFEVCFPPKSPPVGSPIFHWPKWVQKTQNWALLRCVFHPNPTHWISQHHQLALPSFIGQNGSKNPKIGHFWGVFSPQTPNIGSPNITGWLYHLSLAKMGPKTPNWGTFEVCFPPKSPPVGSPYFPLAKIGQKNPKLGTFGVFSPPNPTHWISQHNRLGLPSFVGQNGSKNPKFGHF